MKNNKYMQFLCGVLFIGVFLSQISQASTWRERFSEYFNNAKNWGSERAEGLKQWASENKGKAAAVMTGVLATLGISGYYGYKKYYVEPAKEVAKLTQEYNRIQEENVKGIEEIQQKDDKFLNELNGDLKKGNAIIEVVDVPVVEQDVSQNMSVQEIIEKEEVLPREEVHDISIIGLQGRSKSTFLNLDSLKNLSDEEKKKEFESADYIESAKKSHYYYNFTFTTKNSLNSLMGDGYKVHASTVILLSKDMKMFLFDSKKNVRNIAQKLAETELKKNIYQEEGKAYSVVFILMDYEDETTTETSLKLVKNLFSSSPADSHYKNTKLTLMIAGKGHLTENLKDILKQVGSISTSKQTPNAQFVLEKLHTVYLSYNCINGFVSAIAGFKEKTKKWWSKLAPTTPLRLDQFFTNLDHTISFYNWYVYDGNVSLLHEKYFESYMREKYNKYAFFSNICLFPVVVGDEIWQSRSPLKKYSERILVDLFFGRMRSLLVNAELFEQNQNYCLIEEKNQGGDTQKVYFIDDIFLPRGAQLAFHNQLAKRGELAENVSIQEKFVGLTNEKTYDILRDEVYYNKSEANKDGEQKINMFEMLPSSTVSSYIANSLKYMIPSSKKTNDIKEIIGSYAKKGIEEVKEQVN